MAKNVAAYIRVSTDGQLGEDKFGLDAQKEKILEYCSRNDMNIVEWFSDEGESGAKERPGFDEIVYGESFGNPPYEALVVAKSDRVARDINVYYYYKMMLRKKDVELISVAEDFGQFGVFSNMLEAFTMCVAEMERENITKRTSGGRKMKAAKGGYAGGRAPMGYKIQNGKLVINEDEAPVVRFIFERKKAGQTMLGTVSALNEAGYRTRGGKEFVISTVQSIWNNERTYRGEYKYGEGGTWVKGQHEPILVD
ncbi:MAG: recombinase family protein [Clostridia bacterium]|nr:recombinase family protein [Clostridia bacterium]